MAEPNDRSPGSKRLIDWIVDYEVNSGSLFDPVDIPLGSLGASVTSSEWDLVWRDCPQRRSPCPVGVEQRFRFWTDLAGSHGDLPIEPLLAGLRDRAQRQAPTRNQTFDRVWFWMWRSGLAVAVVVDGWLLVQFLQADNELGAPWGFLLLVAMVVVGAATAISFVAGAVVGGVLYALETLWKKRFKR